jgi:hypothetical protein
MNSWTSRPPGSAIVAVADLVAGLAAVGVAAVAIVAGIVAVHIKESLRRLESAVCFSAAWSECSYAP